MRGWTVVEPDTGKVKRKHGDGCPCDSCAIARATAKWEQTEAENYARERRASPADVLLHAVLAAGCVALGWHALAVFFALLRVAAAVPR